MTTPSVQVNEPSIGEAISDEDKEADSLRAKPLQLFVVGLELV